MAVMGNCIANWDMRRQARVVLPEFWPVPEMRRRLGKDFIGYGVWGLGFDGKITFFFPHAMAQRLRGERKGYKIRSTKHEARTEAQPSSAKLNKKHSVNSASRRLRGEKSHITNH